MFSAKKIVIQYLMRGESTLDALGVDLNEEVEGVVKYLRAVERLKKSTDEQEAAG